MSNPAKIYKLRCADLSGLISNIMGHNQELAKLARSVKVLKLRIHALEALLLYSKALQLRKEHELLLEEREILNKRLDALKNRRAFEEQHFD
jgi:cell division protein FtsB